MQKEFEVFYAKKPSKKAVETVAGLYVDEFVSGLDVVKAINDFCLLRNTNFGDKVIKYLKEGV